MKKSNNRIGGATIALLMMAGTFLAAGATAQAQYRQYPDGRVRQERRDRDDRYHRDRRANRRRDRDGDGDYDRRDREIRRQRQQQRNGGYYGRDPRDRDGDGDYDQRDVYIIRQQQRRDGGYGTYGRNGGYGDDGGYNQAALNQGYQNGLNTGASDAQRGQSYNPQRPHFYKPPVYPATTSSAVQEPSPA